MNVMLLARLPRAATWERGVGPRPHPPPWNSKILLVQSAVHVEADEVSPVPLLDGGSDTKYLLGCFDVPRLYTWQEFSE